MAIAKMLADTSFVIDVGKNCVDAVNKVRELEKQGLRISVPSVVVFELSAGSPSGLEEKRRTLLAPLEIISLEFEHAIEGGKIYRELKEKGEEIPAPDCMIAGMALVEGIPLITDDVEHFKRIPRLSIESYR